MSLRFSGTFWCLHWVLQCLYLWNVALPLWECYSCKTRTDEVIHIRFTRWFFSCHRNRSFGCYGCGLSISNLNRSSTQSRKKHRFCLGGKRKCSFWHSPYISTASKGNLTCSLVSKPFQYSIFSELRSSSLTLFFGSHWDVFEYDFLIVFVYIYLVSF